MGETVTIPSWKSYEYREVWRITQYCISQTGDKVVKDAVSVGFCHISRPMQADEIYSQLPTSLTKKEYITLTLIK